MLHGNNKSNDELEMAITAGVGRIVVDNFDELTRLQRIARKEKRVQGVHLRLTPGIDAHTHRSLSTGEISSKFGIALGGEEPFLAAIETERSPNLSLMGIHCHIGSQIFEAAPYAEAIRVMLGFAAELNRRTGIVVRELNLGGGLGVNYMADGVTEIDPSAADHCAFLAREVMTQPRNWGYLFPASSPSPGAPSSRRRRLRSIRWAL
jgi:diaminopimelate decarboxylase